MDAETLSDPEARAAFERAVEKAADRYFGSLLTEPMTVRELAVEWFKVGRNKMAAILRSMEGVERCGRRYRVPVAKMPPAYHAARGLLDSD